MTSHEASSSASSKSELWSYDVFLSFSGEDTRNGFTSHLHEALKDRGYHVFIDEDDLKRGEEIKEKLFDAIEESRISIIVFSKMYADSSWCLDELVKIMECKDKLGRHVLPIFYHVDPSHVRKQDRDLAEAFQKQERDIREEKDDKKRRAKQERVKQWRGALTKAADLSGHHLPIANNRREAEFIKKIVDEDIREWLSRINELHVPKHLVGIKSRIQGIISDLSSGGSNDVLMVGILGMGGLGKTTAAKAIYNQIHHMFKFKSFLADVSDATSKHGLAKLISGILKNKSEISCVDEGIGLIKQQFRHSRVLVVMDNIDEVEQLDAIVGSHDWFGPGSRIIITTRDERVLQNVDKVYLLQEMNKDEALELFSWHAFRNRWPDEEYIEISKKVVSYCGGLPLALEVLGSFLFKRPIKEWKSQLEKLKRIPEEKIIESLRISFEGLDDTEKASFLDISCFFVGEDKDYVAKILDGCGFYATVGISVLRERCLVTVECNKLYMHDLLREMARVIISEKSPDHPGKWSRLWNRQEVTDVLTNKSGTGKIEGLALHLPYRYGNASFSTKAFAKMKKLRLLAPLFRKETKIASFSTKAFAKMKKLRLLHLSNVELKGEYKHLPKELIWLRWIECPLKSIPDDFFNQDKLVVLDMRKSKLVQVWKGSKSLHNLKTLDLSWSDSLQKSLDFSQVPNLEELILENCQSLSEIHPSIGHLKRLSLVNLRWCVNLCSLPRDFYKLKSVETLLLNMCWKFRELHKDIGEMISLRILEVDMTSVREVPHSIVRLKNLTRLSLDANLRGAQLPHLLIEFDLGSLIYLQHLHLQGNMFHSLPNLSGLSKLETLWLNGSINLHTILDLPTNLKVLFANDCPALETMPGFSKMSNMRELNVSHSPKLTEVPGLDESLNSMVWINMHGCPNIRADFRKNILQGWTSCKLGGIALHGNYVPDWFDFVNEGTKVSFDIPPTDDRNFEGLTLFCLFHVCKIKYLPELDINVTSTTKHTKLQPYKSSGGKFDENYEDDYLWQGQLSNNELNLQGGDKVDIVFEHPWPNWDYSVKIMRTGVNLVWDKLMKENMHDLEDTKTGTRITWDPDKFGWTKP